MIISSLRISILQHRRTETAIQFLRYVLVGGIAFTLDFLTLYVLKEWGGLHYLLAATLAFCVGVIVNYQISIRWVFNQRIVKNAYTEFLIFAFIGVIGAGLNAFIISLLTEKAGLFYLNSKLVAAALILIFNFSARKIVLFSKRDL